MECITSLSPILPHTKSNPHTHLPIRVIKFIYCAICSRLSATHFLCHHLLPMITFNLLKKKIEAAAHLSGWTGKCGRIYLGEKININYITCFLQSHSHRRISIYVECSFLCWFKFTVFSQLRSEWNSRWPACQFNGNFTHIFMYIHKLCMFVVYNLQNKNRSWNRNRFESHQNYLKAKKER